jgi:predicted ATPase
MAELDTITIKGFKSIASIEKLKLGAINVVIGPNGAGKSNFIEVFAILHAIRKGHLQKYVAGAGGAEKVLHFGSKVTKQIHLEISFQDQEGMHRYKLDLMPAAGDELIPVSEWVYFSDKAQYPDSPECVEVISRIGKEAGISAARGSIAAYVSQHLGNWRIYHVHDTSSNSPMKKTADLNDNRYLRPDGSNIAPFLYYLREKNEAAYSLIRRTVQRVAPFFDDFQLEPLKLNPNKILLEWKHRGSEAYFDASSLSDGTLRFIVLTTLFLQPDADWPSVILVDEPELGLHPYAITMLASLIKQASVKTQVIISTQSPFLLDHFQPEDVLVADRVDGATQFTRLDSAKLSGWLEDYSLGQLWEKNEFGGRPTPE